MKTAQSKAKGSAIRNVRRAIASCFLVSATVLALLAVYVPGSQSLEGASSLNGPAAVTNSFLAPALPDCGGFSSPITCADASPRTDSFAVTVGQSVSNRMLSLAVTPDGQRLYGGTVSGVWRSPDSGVSWHQLTRPQPALDTDSDPHALAVPLVFQVAVSPVQNDGKDVVFAATGKDLRVHSHSGVYVSADGGESWRLAFQFACQTVPGVSQIVLAPDDPNLVFAAGGCAIAIGSKSAEDPGWHNAKWVEVPIPNAGTVWNLAVAPKSGSIRRVYGAGPNQLWYSDNAGNSWYRDSGNVPPAVQYGDFSVEVPVGGNSSAVLALDPQNPTRLYLAVPALANGPIYFAKGNPPDGTPCDPTTCGEGSIWLGDYSNFLPKQNEKATWRQLPGPPNPKNDATMSGRVYIVTHRLPNGHLLFFSDFTHVYVAQIDPSAGKAPENVLWHRLSGNDPSESRGDFRANQLFVHVDPHAIAVSPDLDMTLKPATAPAPYNLNSELDQCTKGTIYMSNDGGVYRSVDCGRDGVAGWSLGRGLANIQGISGFAGLAVQGEGPALYYGGTDDDNFFSVNGGQSWQNHPTFDCADCGAFFSDPSVPDRVLEIEGLPRGTILLDIKPPDKAQHYPNGSNKNNVLLDGSLYPPGFTNEAFPGADITQTGYRPLVLSLAGEQLCEGCDTDFILLHFADSKGNPVRQLLRTTKFAKLAQAPSAQVWDTTATEDGPDTPVFKQGPPLPQGISPKAVVQASGGHDSPTDSPTFYVGDPEIVDGTKKLWKWHRGMLTWQEIVPSTSPSPPYVKTLEARRFFVDPYNPKLIYILDQDGIKRSDDGGQRWVKDALLDQVVTENGAYSYKITRFGGNDIGETAVLNDMVFDPAERYTRFAIGTAGVFFTVNGRDWQRLLSTMALPGYPKAAYFDRISDPSNRAVYLAMDGRGILRLSPIPVVPNADLSVTKTDSPDPVTAGKNVTYTVTVNNNGPNTATSVIVTDNLPAETTFVSCSSTGGGVRGGSGNNRTVTFASLASGESETITFVATVNCSVADGAVISNTATVSSSTSDPNLDNDSVTATTTTSNPPPVITGVAVDKPFLWPPNHRLENVAVNYQVTDNCPLPPNSCMLDVASNEPINGNGDGDTSPDWIVLDAHHVQLRAERAGNGNGRIYTIAITCTDSDGNSSHQSVAVNVPHDHR